MKVEHKRTVKAKKEGGKPLKKGTKVWEWDRGQLLVF